MSRPNTKMRFIESSNEKYEKLVSMIQSLTEEEKNQPFTFEVTEKMKENHWRRDKNLRDVLIHLYEWHQLLLDWVRANQNGEKKSFLPEPYTWKNYVELNLKFGEKHQSTSFEEAYKRWTSSHQEVMHLAETFSDDELFEKKYFTWTGTTSLGSYFVSSVPSHYEWAIKKLKKQMKA
ncbi:ClbS/DfsB family four-helix bundle protein [Jeotgalibaca caeni]|uniref:ClbS/DfsB family four-helix bundle protein n=1 Tax=Jeotgalibaca caeni TaxID=3028623 RepID=UPI00237D5698|nr:ClbS/DfsB family four-helix bundle protein [Jeotgalibaca caeni]MDE1549269.1 ClbS/DfsB family four-helix bundle protein [Jeotgalibaca caeni]